MSDLTTIARVTTGFGCTDHGVDTTNGVWHYGWCHTCRARLFAQALIEVEAALVDLRDNRGDEYSRASAILERLRGWTGINV